MKEYQSLIGKIIIAVAIVIAGIIIANAIANAIEAGCANIGSQIASAISFS